MRQRVLPLLVAGALALSTVLFAALVQAADTGTIEGKVNLPIGHTWDPDGSDYGSVTAYLVDGTSLDWAGYGEIQSDGTYTVTDLGLDQQYVVCVTTVNIHVDPGDLMTTCHGGFSSLENWLTELDSAMTPVVVPAVPGTLANLNIDMVAAATISGTVYRPDTTPYPGDSSGMALYEIDGNGTMSRVDDVPIEADGSYSFVVVPGASYAIVADAIGYPATWLGGYVGVEEPTLPDPLVTVVTAPASGQTLSGQDITLTQGFSISGSLDYVILDSDYPSAQVYAMAVGTDGTTYYYGKGVYINGPGAYQIDGLIPGVSYIVCANTSLYSSETCYPGAVVPQDLLSLPHDQVTGVTEVTHPTPGGMVSGIDFEMIEQVTITGSVSPDSVWENVLIYACPVFTLGGQDYFLVSPMKRQVVDVDGHFTFTVDAGWDYVIFAQPDGHTDAAWYGGYIGDSGYINEHNQCDCGFLPSYYVLPDSPLITLVSAAPGQTISDVDLAFGQVGPVMVTIVVDGVNTVITVAPDGTVVLPTPTKAGFTFVGWFTDLDDPGSQFSAATPVTSDLTLYAKWAPTSVTPLGTVSSVTAVAVSGTGDPGSVVTVTFPNGATRTVTVGAAGIWSVPTPVGVSSGKIVVVITDPVTGATSTLTLDFKAPVAVLTGGAAAYPVGGLLVLIVSGFSIVVGVALMRRSLLT